MPIKIFSVEYNREHEGEITAEIVQECIIRNTLVKPLIVLELKHLGYKETPGYQPPSHTPAPDGTRPLAVMTFGKHKDKDIEEVPDSYLRWMIDQEWAEDRYPELVEAANVELKYRSDFNKHVRD